MLNTFRSLPPNKQMTVALIVLGGLFTIATLSMLLLLRTNFSTVQGGQTILLITTVGGFAVQAWREARNRQWAIEDRKQQADQQTAEIIAKAQAQAAALLITTEAQSKAKHLELMAQAERIRLEAVRAANVVRQDARLSTERLEEQIADVKKVSTDAVQVANDVNNKIENLNSRLLEHGVRVEHDNQRRDRRIEDAATATPPIVGQKLDAIQQTTEGIDHKVDAIKDAVTPESA